MPFAPPRICGCGHRIAHGERCQCQRKADTERKARHDENRPNAAKRGYGGKWRAARVTFLAANPKCVRCGSSAEVVNHIVAHRGDLKLFWRRSNWEAVCTRCHNSTIQREEKAPKP